MSNVLIIEDDPAQIEILTASLTTFGHKVSTASTAIGGIKYAVTELPDIIVLDEILPDMVGTDVLRELKEEGSKTSSIPVIIYTGFTDPIVEKEALEIGASKFLLKFTTDPQTLNTTILEILNTNQPQEPSN